MRKAIGAFAAVSAALVAAAALVAGCEKSCKEALTCPAGYDKDLAACTCKPASDNKCAGVSCGASEVCLPATGKCEERCAAITCPSGHQANAQTCVCEPSAVKCHGVQCTGGQACNPATGACEASPGGGVIRTDLINKQMSVGVNNNGGDAPQGAEEVYLDFNWSVSPKNQVLSVAVAPGSVKVDGADTDVNEWKGVPSTTLSLARASELINVDRRTNGTVGNIVTEDFGISEVKVRSAYDGSNIYFRAEWTDNTENSDRGRWKHDGTMWVRDEAQTQPVPSGNRETTRPVTRAEDRVQLMFNINIPDYFGANANQGLGKGCAGLCHLEGKGGVDPATVVTVSNVNYYSGKGRMYTYAAGLKADLWHWKSYRSNALRIYDDQYFDHEKRKGDSGQSDEWSWTTANCSKKVDGARVPTGDTSKVMLHFVNEWFNDVTGCPSNGPSRIPSPYNRAPFAKYMYEDGSPHIGARGTKTAMLDATFVPQAGDLSPGYIFRTPASTSLCGRCNNEAEGKWANNTWVVEFKRTLVAPDADDVDFTKVQ
ncbi:MAG: hypothetical protein HYZ28_29150 [Myxococcales bacterium]|nr:hypothetical protein [Myxococcales bacterium]